MTFSLCSRCRTNNFEQRNDHCYACNGDGDVEDSTLPIPAWVTEHVSFQAWEVRDIRAVQLGLESIPNSIGGASKERKPATVTQLPKRRRSRWRRPYRDFFPILQNGVVEI